MELYQIILIILAAVIVVAGITYLIVYLKAKSNKRKSEESSNAFYTTLIKWLGGIKNIEQVSSISSRLSVVLKNPALINENEFTNKGIGIVKSSKKITLVVGEKASYYCEKINEELAK